MLTGLLHPSCRCWLCGPLSQCCIGYHSSALCHSPAWSTVLPPNGRLNGSIGGMEWAKTQPGHDRQASSALLTHQMFQNCIRGAAISAKACPCLTLYLRRQKVSAAVMHRLQPLSSTTLPPIRLRSDKLTSDKLVTY